MKLPFKRLLAALLAALTLLALAGCGSSGKTDAAPKDYTQILHDARPDEDNEYYMIFSPGKEGKFTAQYGYSESYEDADQLDEEIRNMLLPLLNLEEGDYTDFAASVSGMMVQSYALAIVKPAEGKQQAVSEALDAYVQSQMQSMEHYLEDQYQIAASSHISTAPTGEVILVCCENPEAVMNAIKRRWPLKIGPCTSFTAPCFRGAVFYFLSRNGPKRPPLQKVFSKSLQITFQK